MACPSIITITQECGAEGNLGGIEKLYMIAFKDLVNIGVSQEVYSKSTSGLVNEIGVLTAKNFVEIPIANNTSGITSEMTKDNATRAQFFTETLPLVLAGLSIDNSNFVASVMSQKVAIIVKDANGNFLAMGLNGKTEVTAMTTGTGTAATDLSGFNITFSGTSRHLPMLVDPSIIADLLIPAP